MSNKEQETYIQRLAALGYCWQFITLAGLHQTALIADQFTKDYAKRGMAAYGETIQEKEAEVGTDVLTHQKVSLIILLFVLFNADFRLLVVRRQLRRRLAQNGVWWCEQYCCHGQGRDGRPVQNS